MGYFDHYDTAGDRLDQGEDGADKAVCGAPDAHSTAEGSQRCHDMFTYEWS